MFEGPDARMADVRVSSSGQVDEGVNLNLDVVVKAE